MLKQFMIFACFSVLAFSCIKQTPDDTSHFYKKGKERSSITFFPIFDKTGSDVAWSLSEEFTDSIHYYLEKTGSFSFIAPKKLQDSPAGLDEACNPFGTDLNWIPNHFKTSDFVVFTELIEHHIHPKKIEGFFDQLKPPYELQMSIRIRVVDLRSKQPLVILQELVTQSHLVSKTDLSKKRPDTWQQKAFLVSSVGFAHMQFSKEVAKRIEDYILLAKH